MPPKRRREGKQSRYAPYNLPALRSDFDPFGENLVHDNASRRNSAITTNNTLVASGSNVINDIDSRGVNPADSSRQSAQINQLMAGDQNSASSRSGAPVGAALGSVPVDTSSSNDSNMQSMIQLAVELATASMANKISELENKLQTSNTSTAHLHFMVDKSITDALAKNINAFVDFKALIGNDKQDLTFSCNKEGHLVPSNKSNKKQLSIDEWTAAFLKLTSATLHISHTSTEEAHKRCQDMLAYLDTVRYVAITLKQENWETFDLEFRQLLASDSKLSWSNINNTMWLKAFSKSDNAITKDQKQAKPASQKQICRYFNSKRGCFKKSACDYEHVCSTCSLRNHGASMCFKNKFRFGNAENNQESMAANKYPQRQQKRD